MSAPTSHSPQEFLDLYNQLSPEQQQQVADYLYQLVEQGTQDNALEKFKGCLAGKTDKVLTIEEMNEIAAAGWAGEFNQQ